MVLFLAFISSLFFNNGYAKVVREQPPELLNRDATKKVERVYIASENELSEAQCLELDEIIKGCDSLATRCDEKKNPQSCDDLKMSLDGLLYPERYGEKNKVKWNIFYGTGEEDSATSIKLNSGEEKDPLITYQEGSVIKKFSHLVPMDDQYKVQIIAGELWTLNQFTGCDLKRGKIKIQGTLTKRVSVHDELPKKMVNFYWSLYKKIDQNREIFGDEKENPLVQSALFGHFVGRAIRASHREKVTSVKKIFNYFVSQESDLNKIRLNLFKNSEELKSFIEQEESSEQEVEINWSN